MHEVALCDLLIWAYQYVASCQQFWQPSILMKPSMLTADNAVRVSSTDWGCQCSTSYLLRNPWEQMISRFWGPWVPQPRHYRSWCIAIRRVYDSGTIAVYRSKNRFRSHAGLKTRYQVLHNIRYITFDIYRFGSDRCRCDIRYSMHDMRGGNTGQWYFVLPTAPIVRLRGCATPGIPSQVCLLSRFSLLLTYVGCVRDRR